MSYFLSCLCIWKEISYKLDAPIECYNLFLQKYENVEEKIFGEFDGFYSKYIKYCKAGEFVRLYKSLEKAKEAVDIRNEWMGWGNVNKKNIYTIDYECLKTTIEEAEMNLAERVSQFCESEITMQMITTLEESDIPELGTMKRQEKKRIGFCV